MMQWEKLGLVYSPDGNSDWAKHSALQPTPLVMTDRIRVYCGMRDCDGASRVGFVDLDSSNPKNVLGISKNPVLDVGAFGTFDQNGVVPCAVLYRENAIYMYYAGYLRGENVRFQVFGGLAISNDQGLTFERYSQAPVLDRTPDETLFRVIHSIFFEDGKWRTWYGGGSKFINGKNKTLPVYNIRYTESEDGIKFPADGSLAVDNVQDEHRVGRPYVIKHGERYMMFFGRGSDEQPYRLTYADSDDGYNWTRHGDIEGLTLSDDDWDSEMMAYPAVVTTRTGTYMFYNGNNYGHDGFGCAKLISW